MALTNAALKSVARELDRAEWVKDGLEFKRVPLLNKALSWDERHKLQQGLEAIDAQLEQDEHDCTLYWAVRYKR